MGPNGALSRHVLKYRSRQIQIDMALAVCEAIEHKQNLVVEAGTGVGKTFAYLIPALLSGKQVLLSTGSKNLQDQLFYKDLPALLTMLKLHPKLALLKGRSNYLCQLRLGQAMEYASRNSEQALDHLLKISQWASVTKDGDIGNLTTVPEHSNVIETVVSTKESCTGSHCGHYEACFTRKARLRAMEAKVIVVNHHLFFADKLLKDTGFAEILPDADIVIFDEAHQLPDISIRYFGQQFSTKQITSLLAHVMDIQRQELGDTIQISECCQQAGLALSQWLDALNQSQLTDWRNALKDKVLSQLSWALLAALTQISQLLLHHLGRSEALDLAVERLQALTPKLAAFFECNDVQAAYSVALNRGGAMLSISPIDVAKQCQSLFATDTRWIFTSATLQMERSLGHFCKQIGQAKARQLIMDSPFDYPKQALFCVPRHLAKSSQGAQTAKQLVDICVPAINAAKGRTFVLFTSHQMLEQVALLLRTRVNYPLLVQGQGSKQHLLDKFKLLGNAVLLGTQSFWEGVDVRGRNLSCVIIDKLPFVQPDDTLYRARAANAERQGLDPFSHISLPQAVISLKQGVGRLIRDERDRGVLILCDNRIVNRAYGQAFVLSLPPMSRTRDLDKALHFLKQIP
jgi:ATP-dependent DNA helicase DinG